MKKAENTKVFCEARHSYSIDYMTNI